MDHHFVKCPAGLYTGDFGADYQVRFQVTLMFPK